jgi:two-component system chemotaxis sensor kinase CheA
MSDTATTGSSNAAAFDLTQFYQVFFEEAGDNLQQMEQMLLEVDIESADDETLNAIFRCAHSVKGGAATFGFKDVAELTHQMETLLDKLRRHELAPSNAMVDVLLQSGDALKGQLARHQGLSDEVVETGELLSRIAAFANGQAPATPAVASTSAKPATPAASAAAPATAAAPTVACESATAAPGAVPPAPPGQRWLELTLGPLSDLGLAQHVVELFSEVVGLGQIEPLDGGRSADDMRRFKLLTGSSDDELIDLMGFHVAREQIRLAPLGQGYGFHEGAPGAPKVEAAPAADPSFGFFDDAPGAPGTKAETAPAAPAPAPAPVPSATEVHVSKPVAVKADKAAAAASETTLRVSVEKVDQLINLVGELVITQAMLAQNSKGSDGLPQQFMAGMNDLERNTRDLQEAVMGIRMIPMSMVFNRFPRMLRDLANKLGKKVELVQVGEATELDKGLVEKITDPLTHLVRNSCDHGIELPADRVAKGKNEQGTITLVASHQGGSIVIEVRDDGKGLNRAKLLAKARERGLDAPDSMSDQEVYALIFAPGFSTAEQVTDVSGRGVGMDVVKKNITALGGTVEIDSAEGYGMSVKVRLPLTLAIMDGMSVGVADECYIVPLASVVESFLVEEQTVKTVAGGGRVVKVRDEYMPVIELDATFGVPRLHSQHPRERANGIMVVVEAEGGRVAMLLDELLGQQQVVVKNLETNYRKVDHVSGATILGDGRVALILDIGSLVRQSRH